MGKIVSRYGKYLAVLGIVILVFAFNKTIKKVPLHENIRGNMWRHTALMVMWMVGGKRGINSLRAYFTNNFSNAKKIKKSKKLK